MKSAALLVGLAACAAAPPAPAPAPTPPPSGTPAPAGSSSSGAKGASDASGANGASVDARPAEPPSPASPSLLVPPPRFSEHGGACKVGAPIEVGNAGDGGRHQIEIAASVRGALVAYDDGASIVTVPFDTGGKPSGPAKRSAAFSLLFALRAQPDGTFVALASSSCPADAAAHDQCVSARTFDARGAPLQPVATADLGPRQPFLGAAAVSGARGALNHVQPVFTYPSVTSGLVVRAVPHDGAAATLTTTETAGPISGHNMTMSVQAKPDGAFVVFAETPDGSELVQHEGGKAAIVTRGRFDLLVLGTDGAAYVVPREGAKAARVAPDGAVSEVASTTDATAAAREEILPVTSYTMDKNLTGLAFGRASADKRGPTVVIAPKTAGGLTGAVAWTGSTFLVAWTHEERRGWPVRAVAITCAAP